MAFDPVTAILNIGNTVLDRVLPDKTANDAAKAQLAALTVQGEFANAIAQLQVDQAEAANKSVFVAGWRPFVGWILGGALGYGLVFQPLVILCLVIFHSNFDQAKLPALDYKTILELLGTMLGFGIMRSVDKAQGTGNGH